MQKNLVRKLAKKDPTAAELYNNLLDAKIAFYKYMQQPTCEEIDKCIQGKIQDPKHWRNKMFGFVNPKPKLKKPVKALLLRFHPDKNPDREDLANQFTQTLLQWIANGKCSKVDSLLLSDDPWLHMQELSSKESTPVTVELETVEQKEKFVNFTESTRWFQWDSALDPLSFKNEDSDENSSFSESSDEFDLEEMQRKNASLKKTFEETLAKLRRSNQSDRQKQEAIDKRLEDLEKKFE